MVPATVTRGFLILPVVSNAVRFCATSLTCARAR